jgi:hypothetical protein
MSTTTSQQRTSIGTTTVRESRLTSEQVWHAIAKASFAVVGYVTPDGEPRSSGVMYKVVDGRLCVVVDPDGWKAKHIAANGRVSVTVPVRRGGLLSLLAPIPPATISFHGSATVHAPGSPGVRPTIEALGRMLPAERRDAVAVIEIVPERTFLTYGIGIGLMKMRDTELARARAPVSR